MHAFSAPSRSMRRFRQNAKENAAIDIEIDGHFTSKTYMSDSAITGRIVVRPSRDLPFDAVEISFCGAETTRANNLTQHTDGSTMRRFLTMQIPVSRICFPETMTFKSCQDYMIPFQFVIPCSLPNSACSTACRDAAVRERHRRLPPTMGGWELDDQSPTAAQIEYYIGAKILQISSPDSRFCLTETRRTLNVLPACPEDPPLHVLPSDERYKLSRVKTISKGIRMLAPKGGHLRVSSTQPAAIMLAPDGRGASPSTVSLTLNFTPVTADRPPPVINSVSGSLTCSTFFGSVPTGRLPDLGRRRDYLIVSPSFEYKTTQKVFNVHPGELAWAQDVPEEVKRQVESSIIDTANDSGIHGYRWHGPWPRKHGTKLTNAGFVYTSLLDIHFALPNNDGKRILPTFYSCLTSRTYALHLKLSVGQAKTTISLAVPLQIGVNAARSDSSWNLLA